MNGFVDGLKKAAAAFGGALLTGLSIATVMIDGAYRAMDGLRVLASRYDWPLTPSVNPYVILALAAEAMTGDATQHTIYRGLRDYLRADGWAELRRIVEEMREYTIMTTDRRKIVRDALSALEMHGTRGFNGANLIVPALFAVIDGILNEFACENGIKKWANRKANGPQRLRIAFGQVTHGFDEPALDLIFNVLFSESYVDGKRRLNRHRVLHGEWLRYGNVEHALRAFLILDFLGYAIEEHRQRRAAGDMAHPITYRSQLSKMYSQNFVKDVVPFAIERLSGMNRKALLPAEEGLSRVTQWTETTEPLYEITIDGGEPTVVAASALMDTWRENVPDSAAKVLDLSVGAETTIMETPEVLVRRLR